MHERDGSLSPLRRRQPQDAPHHIERLCEAEAGASQAGAVMQNVTRRQGNLRCDITEDQEIGRTQSLPELDALALKFVLFSV